MFGRLLSVPTILSSLVMVIYNLADTYFVGMMNNPVQNAAVALAAPVLVLARLFQKMDRADRDRAETVEG